MPLHERSRPRQEGGSSEAIHRQSTTRSQRWPFRQRRNHRDSGLLGALERRGIRARNVALPPSSMFADYPLCGQLDALHIDAYAQSVTTCCGCLGFGELPAMELLLALPPMTRAAT